MTILNGTEEHRFALENFLAKRAALKYNLHLFTKYNVYVGDVFSACSFKVQILMSALKHSNPPILLLIFCKMANTESIRTTGENVI